MATDKRKILQSAQKHMQKGALDKALKDYMTLLKADPKDNNIRLKVGDIHLKQGNTDEAVAAYQKVAERFMKDGFDAKAVALYKQISKIDPKRWQIYEPLAELYQRLGLTSDAMTALQTAADAQYRAGNKDEALDLLRKMASLDPSNTTNRLKVADLLRQEGRQEEAVDEFRQVAQELERQGDGEERARVLERVLEIDPAHAETLEGLARLRLEGRDFDRAEATALAFVERHPDELAAYQVLADVVDGAGRIGTHTAHFRKMAELLKARGDDGEARTVMQRFVASGGFGGGDSDEPVLETDDELALETDAPAGELGLETPEFTDPGFAGSDGLRIGEAIEGLGEEEPSGTEPGDDATGPGASGSLPPLPQLDLETEEDTEEAGDEGAAAASEDPDGELDAEQVLAEAGVYLRYGKHERAIEALRRILAREPGHVAALTRLGEAFAAADDRDNAMRALERAAERAREDGDAEAFEAVRAQVAALDPAAAEAFGPAPASGGDEPDITIDSGLDAQAAGDDAATLESGDGIEFEIDVGEDGDTAGSPAAEPAAAGSDAFGPEAEDGEELTLDDGADELALADAADAVSQPEAPVAAATAGEGLELGLPDEETPTDEVAPSPGEEGLSPGDEATADATSAPGRTATLDLSDDGFEIDLDADGEETAGPDETPADDEDAGARSASSSTTPAQIVEELEEGEFYFQQGMHAEARAIYARILEVAPNHPQALLRLGEIEAAGPDVGEGAPEAAAASASAEAAEAEGDELSMPGEGLEEFSFDEEVTAEAALPPAAEEAPAPRSQAEVTAPFGREEAASAPVPDEAAVAAVAGPDRDAGAPEAPADEAAPGGDFDLAAELSDAFDESDPLGDSGPRAGTTEEEGFEQVFAAFKAGVKKELGDGDSEAHYDLGIAYKEMGLLEDAIGEFATAVRSEAHRLPCLHMMALCALDLGRTPDAVAHLEQALSLPDVPQEQQVALRFDLGRAYQAAGDVERARTAFEAVQAADPDFRDVGAQLEALASGAPAPAQPEEEEAFESFDDLLDEADAEPAEETAAGEAYESFDDIMEETEPPVEAEPAPEAEPAEAPVEPEPEPAEPAADPPAGGDDGPKKPGGRRRRKISFV